MLVEDSASDIVSCENQAAMYKAQSGVDISFVTSGTFDEAISKYDNSFDGAIIDLKLGDDIGGGNRVIERIKDLNARIPVCVTTGTPANVDDVDGSFIQSYVKGDFEYNEIFSIFTNYYKSGITKIFSAKGTVEKLLRSIYYESIFLQKEVWFSYGEKDPDASERGLLRHTINNMLHRLDENSDTYFKEEFYIVPPSKNELKTGSIISHDSKKFVILTPACDLVPRANLNGQPKTSHIVLVVIEPQNEYLKDDTSEKDKNKLKSNNKVLNLHYMPSAYDFEGGFINFRNIETKDTITFYDTLKSKCLIQISPFFLKDIISRFSTFYARQGQPDINIM